MPKRRVGRPKKSSSHKPKVRKSRPIKQFKGKVKGAKGRSASGFSGRARVGFVGAMGTYPQTGSRKSVKADRARKAMPPGNRISKSGNLYFENRKNRSDRKGSRL